MMEPFAIIVPMVKRCYQICLTGTLILPLAFERFFIISCCNVKKKFHFRQLRKILARDKITLGDKITTPHYGSLYTLSST